VTSHAFDTSAAGPTGAAACPFMPVFGPPQVMFVRGAGTELWDVDGKRYLDFLCGLAVTSLGHSHPAITEAIGTQAAKLLHVSNFFTNDAATAAAIDLRDLLARRPATRGRCSSATPAPRPTRPHSSSPASSVAEVDTS
jgi:acetylornithine/N-succinyldiaminopimelate aminotransferase